MDSTLDADKEVASKGEQSENALALTAKSCDRIIFPLVVGHNIPPDQKIDR